MAAEKLSLVDSLGSFAPGQPLRAVLVLTYCFDGRWFEEAVAPEVFERPVATALLIRDRNALISELPSVRFRRADAAFSTRVFHPKLALFVAEDCARVFLGSVKWTPFARPKNCRRELLSSPRDFGWHRSVTIASQDDDNRNHPPSCTLAGVRCPND